jgi:ankyrin repeat protein
LCSCGGSTSQTPAEQAEAKTENVPELNPAEQEEADKIIVEHGRHAIVIYLQNWGSKNMDENLAIKYIKYFLLHGADVNEKDESGWTPIHYASDNLEVVVFLVSKGADVNAKGNMGWTPLDMAKERNSVVTEYFESIRAKSGRE